MDLTSDYLDIKDKMGKGMPLKLRRSLASVPDEVSDIKKVKAEDTVDEDDYDEIGLDHEDEDYDEPDEECEDCAEEDQKPKKKKSSKKKKDDDEDDEDENYGDVDVEKEEAIEKFLKSRKVGFKNEVAADLNIEFGKNSTTSNFTNSEKSSYTKSPVQQSIENHNGIKPMTKSSYQKESHQYEYNEEEMYEESHAILVKPKSLKPIGREVVTYILTQKNNIHDANDQSMLASFCCAKLELVDFYLNCIDTKDYRYIVPHNRQYLVQMQNDLNRALQEVLRVKPVNRMDRPWRVNVVYPQGWGG